MLDNAVYNKDISMTSTSSVPCYVSAPNVLSFRNLQTVEFLNATAPSLDLLPLPIVPNQTLLSKGPKVSKRSTWRQATAADNPTS